jgi:hypothetical protein
MSHVLLRERKNNRQETHCKQQLKQLKQDDEADDVFCFVQWRKGNKREGRETIRGEETSD